MRRFVLIAALLVSVPAIAWVSVSPVAAQSTWKRVLFQKEGFSVIVPEMPKIRKEKGLSLYEVVRDKEQMRYAVGYLDLAIAPGNDSKLINEVYEGVKKGAEKDKGDLVAYRTIERNGFPGREMTFFLPDGFAARWRVYIVNKRAYFLSATTTRKNLQTDLAGSVAVFLDSFRLNAKRPAPQQLPRQSVPILPSPSPTPSPTVTPLPSPTPSPTVTPSPGSIPSPTATPSPQGRR
ncbi:MAG: hypothetical protein KME43_01285 [Myxacorys chilensis ATA2-1-KO14]|nr:hypothetical protein [Myxacorys chilensis ATA2-1-KO14]